MEKQTTGTGKERYDESPTRLALLASIVESSDDAIMSKNPDLLTYPAAEMSG